MARSRGDESVGRIRIALMEKSVMLEGMVAVGSVGGRWLGGFWGGRDGGVLGVGMGPVGR